MDGLAMRLFEPRIHTILSNLKILIAVLLEHANLTSNYVSNRPFTIDISKEIELNLGIVLTNDHFNLRRIQTKTNI